MNRHMLKIGQEIHPVHIGKKELHIPYLTKPLIISVMQSPIILVEVITKEENRLCNGVRESVSNTPSVIISRRVIILALEIFSFRSFDLPVVTGAVFYSTKVRLWSAPPTCPKWHFLDKGLEEYRTAKENNT